MSIHLTVSFRVRGNPLLLEARRKSADRSRDSHRVQSGPLSCGCPRLTRKAVWERHSSKLRCGLWSLRFESRGPRYRTPRSPRVRESFSQSSAARCSSLKCRRNPDQGLSLYAQPRSSATGPSGRDGCSSQSDSRSPRRSKFRFSHDVDRECANFAFGRSSLSPDPATLPSWSRDSLASQGVKSFAIRLPKSHAMFRSHPDSLARHVPCDLQPPPCPIQADRRVRCSQ